MKTYQKFRYKIGLVYIGNRRNEPFDNIAIIKSFDDQTALSRASEMLKPNHLQTLSIVEKVPVKTLLSGEEELYYI